MATRQLRVEIVGDPRRLQRAFDSIERSTSKLARGVGRAGTAIGIGIAAIAGGRAVAGIKSTIDAASNLNEAINQNSVIFGRNAKEIEKWAKGSARSMGLSRREAIENAASFGDMFTQLKVGERDALTMSKRMVSLSSDLASFKNADITQVLEAQSSAFRGEYDALQRFIPGITAARVEQVALNMTHKDSAKDLTAAEKAQATYQIMLKDTTHIAGDYANTLGTSVANQERQQRARLEDIKATIGRALLPAWLGVLSFFNDKLLPAFELFWTKHGPAVRDAFSAIGRGIGRMADKAQEWWETHGPAVREAFEKAKDEVHKLGGELSDLKKDWDDNKAAVGGLIDTMRPLTDKILPAVTWLTHRLAADEIGGKFGLIAQVGFLSKAFSFAFKRIVEEFRPVINVILAGNQKMIAGAATVAEALHLPMAKSLRKAEQRMGEFRRNFNEELDRITDERVNVTARAGITWTAEATKFRMAAGRMAAGGPVSGPGTSTSDSVPAMLSRGEFVMNAAATRAIGTDRLNRLNAMRFAQGGAVDPRLRIEDRIQVGDIDRMVIGVAKSLARGLGEKLTKAMGQAFGGGNWGSGSWMRAISELQADRVAYRIISTFRPGARTAAGGRVSFHALNRAVDLTGPNMMGIFQSLSDTRPTELIYSHAPYYIARGRAKPIGALDPITFMNHLSHVHAAYDRGGWLPPGVSVAVNRTGRPERVLAPGEGSVTVHFHGPVYGDRRAITETVRQGLKEALRREGRGALAAQL